MAVKPKVTAKPVHHATIPPPSVTGSMAGESARTGSQPAGTAPSQLQPVRPIQGVSETEQQIYNDVVTKYGAGIATWLQDPEVGPIIRRATVGDSTDPGGWPAIKLIDALANTQWWKKTADSARKWQELKNTDPATAQAQLTAKISNLSQQAIKLGLKVTPDDLNKLAEDSIRLAWDDNKVTDMLAGYFDPSKGTKPVGSIGTLMGSIQRAFAKYNIPLTAQTAGDYAKRIVSGELDLDAVNEMVISQAKARFPYMSDQIDKGLTPDDYTAPLKQTLASELELPDTEIDFNQPQWSSYLDNNTDGTPPSLTDIRRRARLDPKWRFTDSANAQTDNLTMTIMKTFGKIA